MMLLSKKRAGCRAAGCVAAAVEGELTAQQSTNVGQDVGEDTAVLRAVTGQVTARLQAEKPDRPMSFYWHVRGLRLSFDKVGEDEDDLLRVITSEVTQRLQAEKPDRPKSLYAHVRGLRRCFAKAQKRWSRKVAQAMKAEEMDMELLRSLTDGAMMKGFRGGKLEEAVAVVAQYDRQQAVVALMRRFPGRLMSRAADVARDVRGLKGTVVTLETAAAADAESCRTMEDDLRAELVAAHGTNDALQATVDEQQRAAEVAAERSGLAVRRLEDQLQSSRRDASQARASTLAVRQELASCEDNVAEVEEASVALSLVAAESTNFLGGGLQPATSRPAEATTREATGLSAGHEARQRTCQAVASEDATVKNAGASILRTPVEITQRHQHVACLMLEEGCSSCSLPSNILGADEATAFVVAVVLMALVKRRRRGGRFIEDQVCNEGGAHEDAGDEEAATAAAQEAAAENDLVAELEEETSALRSWNAVLTERVAAAERTVAKIRRRRTEEGTGQREAPAFNADVCEASATPSNVQRCSRRRHGRGKPPRRTHRTAPPPPPPPLHPRQLLWQLQTVTTRSGHRR